MLKVYIKPENVFDFFGKNKKSLISEPVYIAECKENDNGIERTIDILMSNVGGRPAIHTLEVLSNSTREVFDNAEMCNSYVQYLLDACVAEEEPCECCCGECCEEFEIDIAAAEEREDSLADAVAGFLELALGKSPSELNIDKDGILEILDEFEIALNERGFSTYHPRILEIDGQISLIDSLADLDDLGISY